MARYRDAEKKDCYELIDLMNYVFKVDFEKVLPKTFSPDFDFEKIAKVAEDENGRLISCVCVLPQQLTVGSSRLNANYLGGVTVHPRHRGEKHMIALMNMWLDEMKDSYDMSVLCGLRQRYEYFGYTYGGVQWEYTVNSHNISHGLRETNSENISFKPLEQAHGAAEFAADFNNQKPVNIYRDAENAGKIMTCYRQHPLAVYENKALIGYIITNLNRDAISEFVLCDFKDTKRVLKAYFEHFAVETLTIILPEYETQLHRELSDFAEGYKTGPCCNVNIFNFANVIRAYLEVKNQTSKLSRGRFSAVMDGQPVTVTVDENGVKVENTADADAVVLDKSDAQKLLLTQWGKLMDVDVPSDWFPLPLFWHRVDMF